MLRRKEAGQQKRNRKPSIVHDRDLERTEHPPKMPCIACCLEPYKVRAEDAAQEVLSHTDASVADIMLALFFGRWSGRHRV
jgi:transposase